MTRDGWYKIAHTKNLLTAHSKVAEKKEKLTKEFISLKKSRDYAECIKSYKDEVAKGCIRSCLRFSSEATEFTKLLTQGMLEEKPEYLKYYVTMPYILFHLPNDKLERGSIHTDRIKECQDSVTVWTPINTFKNSYPAISLFPRSHSLWVNALYRIARKFFQHVKPEDILKQINIKRLDLYPDVSSSYIWDSNLLHVGNLNSTENHHCALVFRISERPLYYEPSIQCRDLIKLTNLRSIDFNFLELYENLSKHIEHIERRSVEALNLEEFISSIYEYRKSIDSETRRALSFTLSLVAQRLVDMPSASYFDLASYMVGKENIVGLERYLHKYSEDKEIEKLFNKLSEFEQFDTYQEFTLLNKFKQRFEARAINPVESSVIYSSQ